ncbi:tetratricopeptide repeat protein [Methylovulum psychrotolerans]|uniref:Glycosyltransferase n=1 Tax=Methylovulum psychrotolerans TaxID=1704499 RepID=A0A2S5CP44_9GAMM|nr:tetratricopeptide repeat-containing glycosyltransferase family protein [Methylovulum psychrotolerans]POZ52585.1 glycosyltransferase [Methylovulum psychrotolerans]
MNEKTAIQVFGDIKALFHDNKLDDALEMAELALQLFPDEAEGHYLCAEIYRQKGINNDQILGYLSRAYELDSHRIEYIGRLAERCFMEGKLDLAISYYQEILSREPVVWGYIGLGNALEMKGEFNVAALYFQRAVDLNPNRSDALLARLEKIRLKQLNTLIVIDEYKKLISDHLDEGQLFDITKLIALLYAGICETTEAAYFYQKVAELYESLLADYGVENPQIIHPGITQSTREGQYGCIRSVNEEGIRGWFFDMAAEPDAPVALDIFLDNKKLGTVVTDTVDTYVSAIYGVPVRCEFSLKWSDVCLDGQFDFHDKTIKHLLTCQVSGTDQYLLVMADPVTLELLEEWSKYGFIDMSGHISDRYESTAVTDTAEGEEDESVVEPVAGLIADYVVTKIIELDDSLKYQYEKIKDGFDISYYLTKYPEVRKEQVDPIAHYLTVGAAKGFDPNLEFESKYYLDNNHDVKDSGVNPFYHYIVSGRYEGRVYKPFAAAERKTLGTLQTLESRAKHWLSRDRNPLVGKSILSLLLDKFLTDSTSIVLSVSHDNAMSGVGGIQLAIQQELELFNAEGYLYIHLYPKQPLPILDLSETSRTFYYGMSLNGTWVGFVSSDCLVEVFSDYSANYSGDKEWLMLVHSLLGCNVDSLLALHSAFKFNQAYLWLHDYFMICPQYTLLRNDITYCNAPKIDKAGCEICVYHDDRVKHLAQFEILFGTIPFSLIAPSAVAAQIFVDKTTLPYKNVVVSPHRYLEKTLLPVPKAKKHPEIRVAYLGQLVGHKGWFEFEKLAETFGTSGKYKFYVFGVTNPEVKHITHLSVHVSNTDPDAMITALKDNAIDVVVLGSKWPETFCFTAHEALVSGAALVAHKDSGNVVALIQQYECGQIYDNIQQLVAMFSGGAVDQLLEASKAYTYTLKPGVMSACVLENVN